MAPLATQQDYIIPESVIAAQDQFSKKLIQAVSATTLPPKAQVEAFADSYFDRFYHRAPLIDRADLSTEDPSVLVSQAICMVGSLLRHSGPDSPLGDAEHYYGKVKTLLYTNYEPDQRNVLKALCLLSFRNLTPPKVVSLDCSWQWLGMATRLAYQMGLHRESTYAQLPNPGNARRIMWSLFVSDRHQTACFGRPSIIRASEFDIRLPTIDDFEQQDTKAELFIQHANLSIILGGIVDRHAQKSEMTQNEAISILESLQQFINNIPSQLQLYEGSNRRPFRPDIYEFHANYFVCLIVFFRLFGHAFPALTVSAASLVASSCIARLYEQFLYRDEMNYLTPLHNWFVMVGCAPQIHHNATCQGRDKLCNEELPILTNALRYMRLKSPPAGVLLDIIERLSEVNSNGLTPSVSSVPQEGSPTEEPWLAQLPHAVLLNSLFPFPGSLSPRLSIIQGINDELNDLAVLDRMVEQEDDDLEWIFNEYQLNYFDASFV
ncbi:hypothetical protein N7509_006877 [Penicillium cosmopolitanum]|uniref:Xylanolytic transcriptional activator regulatory domain-containing protein n=1 Tax=Penicillium cosmopolitanum TaxID=1131564 RepID=A0A9X0B7V4_9EURO|nr:uncharacterized protein N7509_006877 [Penicillium cosmopolitanum]KAJ5391387.1 hypothetical protein N7509_006877 [Penicillium cosmopolitanum]